MSSTDQLTERQSEVLKLLLEGKTTKEIANMLALSEATVKYHISSVYRKLESA